MNYKPEDVLFGRGNGTNHHPGNKYYRKIVKERKVEYCNKAKPGDKTRIAKEVLKSVHDRGGRFLEKTDVEPYEYVEVEESKAVTKITQSLREIPKSEKEQKRNDKSKKSILARETEQYQRTHINSNNCSVRSDVKPKKFLSRGRSYNSAISTGSVSSSNLSHTNETQNVMGAARDAESQLLKQTLEKAIIANEQILSLLNTGMQQQQQTGISNIPCQNNTVPQNTHQTPTLNPAMMQGYHLNQHTANQQGLVTSINQQQQQMMHNLNINGLNSLNLNRFNPSLQYGIDTTTGSISQPQPRPHPSQTLSHTHIFNQKIAASNQDPFSSAIDPSSTTNITEQHLTSPPVMTPNTATSASATNREHSLALNALDHTSEDPRDFPSNLRVFEDLTDTKRQTSHHNEAYGEMRKKQNRQKSVEFNIPKPSRSSSDDTVFQVILDDLLESDQKGLDEVSLVDREISELSHDLDRKLFLEVSEMKSEMNNYLMGREKSRDL